MKGDSSINKQKHQIHSWSNENVINVFTYSEVDFGCVTFDFW